MSADVQVDDDPLIGSEISGYRVEAAIGRGGMGAVYRAVQSASDAEVAIKVLAADLVGDHESSERFVNEARIANRVRHEGLVKVLFVGLLPDDRPYLIMEHLTGAPLSSLIGTVLPRRTLLERLAEAVRAIGAMHAAGVIHRDLKPANLFVTTAGFIKVLDFGIAKLAEARRGLTRTGHSIGTPGYMSPEQANAEPVDHRTDIYSLGVVLYEAIAGERPFEGRLVEALVASELPPAIGDPVLDAVIARAMAPDRDARFATAEELADELERIASALPSSELGPLIAQALPVRLTPIPDPPPTAAPATVDLRSGDVATAALPTAPAKPQRLGRYVIEGTAGRGGEGVVLVGIDPKVKRKVALKLLELATTDHRERLIAEAQAMARVSHPNVVTLYELGEDGDRLFLAMEFLEETDLAHWLAERPRSWREILAMFLAAGEGLAAAHAVGVVHRDFKPANVLLGKDGRPKVGDFGIAEVGTSSGDAAGTVAFMPPEQLEGGAVDPRSDQFAFCSALWQALHGEPPYAGDTAMAMAMAAQRGELRSPVRGVPAGLTAALRRGLAARPDDRFADMRALLAELRRAPARGRLRVLAVVAGLAAAGGLAYALVPGGEGPPPSTPPAISNAELQQLEPGPRLHAIASLPRDRLEDPEVRWLARDAVLDGTVRRIEIPGDPLEKVATFSATGALLAVPTATELLLIDQTGVKTRLTAPPGVPSRIYVDDVAGQVRALIGDEILATPLDPGANARWTSVARCRYDRIASHPTASADLTVLACTGTQGAIQIGGVARGPVIEGLDAVAFSPSAARVAIRRATGALEVYQLADPVRLIARRAQVGDRSLALSDDLVAFASPKGTTVWDPTTDVTADVPFTDEAIALTAGAAPVLVATTGARSVIAQLEQPLALVVPAPPRPGTIAVAGARLIEQQPGEVVVRDIERGIAWRQRGATSTVAADRTGSTLALFDGHAVRWWTIAGPPSVAVRGRYLAAFEGAIVTRRLHEPSTVRLYERSGNPLATLPGKALRSFNVLAIAHDGATEIWHRDRGTTRIFDEDVDPVIEHAGEHYANVAHVFTRLRDRRSLCGGGALTASADGASVLVFQSDRVVVCRLPAGDVVPLAVADELDAAARTRMGSADEVTWELTADHRSVVAFDRGVVHVFDATTGAQRTLPKKLAELHITNVRATNDGLLVRAREGVFAVTDDVTPVAPPDAYTDAAPIEGGAVVIADGHVAICKTNKPGVRTQRCRELGMLASTLPGTLTVVGDSVIASDVGGTTVMWSLAAPTIEDVDRWLAGW